MKKNKHIINPYLLMTGCILFAFAGLIILFFGALSHINPNVHFSALFSKEPFMNLIYSIIPSLQ